MPPTLRGLRGLPVTFEGWLNFLFFQWFCVRLARFYRVGPCTASHECTEQSCRYRELELTHREFLRWIWPLTGWWSDFRYIKWVRP